MTFDPQLGIPSPEIPRGAVSHTLVLRLVHLVSILELNSTSDFGGGEAGRGGICLDLHAEF